MSRELKYISIFRYGDQWVVRTWYTPWPGLFRLLCGAKPVAEMREFCVWQSPAEVYRIVRTFPDGVLVGGASENQILAIWKMHRHTATDYLPPAKPDVLPFESREIA
jgi:hypothetical protein